MAVFRRFFPILACLALLFIPILVCGQAEDNAHVISSKDISTTLAFTLAIIAGVISLVTALVVTNRRVRAEVEKLVQEKAKTFVDELFTKDLDIDLETARAFFGKLRADAQKLSETQVWIINDQGDEDRKQLFESIRQAGFMKPKSALVQQRQIKPEPGDLIVFDGTQNLSEEQIVTLGQSLESVAYFFYYGSRYDSNDQLRMRGYANTPNTLVKRLKEVVLD